MLLEGSAILLIGEAVAKVPGVKTGIAMAATLTCIHENTGLAVETLLIGTGVLRYTTPWPGPMAPPVWIAALWLAFATTLPATRALIAARIIPVAAVAGLAFGPLSYLAGQSIGAVTLPAPSGWIAVAAAWAVLYPLLLQIDRRLRG